MTSVEACLNTPAWIVRMLVLFLHVYLSSSVYSTLNSDWYFVMLLTYWQEKNITMAVNVLVRYSRSSSQSPPLTHTTCISKLVLMDLLPYSNLTKMIFRFEQGYLILRRLFCLCLKYMYFIIPLALNTQEYPGTYFLSLLFLVPVVMVYVTYRSTFCHCLWCLLTWKQKDFFNLVILHLRLLNVMRIIECHIYT